MFKQEGAIGILEYSTIPQGMKVLNDIVKRVKLTHIEAKIFPGAKYMIMMQGEHGSIEYAMEIGIEQEGLFDIGWMGKIHSLMVPVFNEELYSQDRVENVLIFQQTSHAKAFELCNVLLHSFDLTVVQMKYTEALEGQAVVVMSGGVADIRGAKEFIKCGEILTNVEPWLFEEVVR